MSTQLARAPRPRALAPVSTPATPAPSSPNPRPSLRLVEAPAPGRSKVAFLLLCIAILAGAMVTALVMNTAMAAGAYQKYDLNEQLTELQSQQYAAREAIEDASSALSVADAARGLGMVPAPAVAGIRLADGTIQGEAAAATAPPSYSPQTFTGGGSE